MPAHSAAVGHLLRRAGFGPSASTWVQWAALSYDDAVDRVLAELDAPPPQDPPELDPFKPGTIQDLWLNRMLKAPAGLAEKLTLFWHGHFATSETKFKDAQLMWSQYGLLRAKGSGSFRDLLLGVSKDVAMIRWLDGNSNRVGHANENYARELQELFTLGIGNYTEQDIREIGRAFTGWGSRHHDFVFRDHFHDNGEKTIHGKKGNFGGEDVVDILVHLPACSRHIAGKLLRFFSHPDPSTEEIETLATVFRESKLNIKATLAALFRGEAFRSAAHQRSLVKSPVEFCIGGLRAVGATTVPGWLHGATDRMGQILFRPPSVKGWTSGKGWLSSGAIVERLRAAQRVALLTPETTRANTAGAILSVTLQDEVPAAMQSALDVVAAKIQKAEALAGKSREPMLAAAHAEHIALVLASPEYQLS